MEQGDVQEPIRQGSARGGRAAAIRRGQTINERPRPRVLVLGFGEPANDTTIAEVVAEVAPTVETARRAGQVDLHEYDAVVTGSTFASIDSVPHPDTARGWSSEPPPNWWKWTQDLPPHVSIFYIPSGNSGGLIDFSPAEGEGADLPDVVLLSEPRVVGTHVTYVRGLPGHLDDLVKRHAAPRAQLRDHHVTFDRRVAEGGSDRKDALEVRPLLLGPRDAMLAFTYQRSAEAAAWVLPVDLVGDLKAWVVAAFREWHELYLRRFPAVADWRTHGWTTPAEDAVSSEIASLEAAFADATREFEARRAELDDALTAAAASVDAYERALLTGTGDELERAAARALSDLGFQVEEMDETWPADARREDYRITDPDAADWIAVGEAKGFRKGVSETGLQSLARWVRFYVLDHRAVPSAQWYIANQFLLEDPATRPAPLHGRDDVVASFAADDGLLLDTRVLFRLVVTSQRHPGLKPRIRELLRSARGRLSEDDVATELRVEIEPECPDG